MPTGLSDDHKMNVTVLKTTSLKSKPKVITYMDYRSSENDKLKTDLDSSLRVRNVTSYLLFEEIFLHVLQRHASIKQKVTRVNHAQYMTKAMRKEFNYSMDVSKTDLVRILMLIHIREISAVDYIKEKKRHISTI